MESKITSETTGHAPLTSNGKRSSEADTPNRKIHPIIGNANYKAINSAVQEIRLLVVAPGSPQDIVQCTLKQVSLLDQLPPEYETISYCWGAPKNPSFIELDGHEVPVPASSEAAVKRMRLMDRPRVLWIDAICIDQSSLEERSEQVTLMPIIYRSGKRNLVHLGDDDEGVAEQAMETINCVLSDMHAEVDNLNPLSNMLCDRVTNQWVYSTKGFNTTPDFKSLERLFDLPWFTRLWVIQESALAPINLCYWGILEFDLADVLTAAMWLGHKYQYITNELNECTGWACAIYMAKFHENIISQQHVTQALDEMILVTQDFKKAELRDGVYAVLGLLTKNNPLDDRHAALLKVDYAKPIPDVLRDATRYALIESGTLWLLGWPGCGLPDENIGDGFPTWAVQADQSLNTKKPQSVQHWAWACSGLEPSSLLADTSYGLNVLLGEGFIADRALETTTTWDGCFSDCEGYCRWLALATKLGRQRYKQETSGDPEDNYLSMAFTFMAGGTTSGRPAQLADVAGFRDYLDNLSIHDDTLSTGDKMEQCIQELRKTSHGARADCRHRRFFITAEGRMGIGPRSMRADDLIVILRGGRLPFILRGNGAGGYWLVGGAYVHGIMNGEAVQEWKARNEPEKIFHIV